MAKFDISKFAQTSGTTALDTPRDIETITGEILKAKRVGGEAILTIGQRLIEAKALLPHGEWLPWLEDEVEFSERTARNFMRLARDWTNRQALADLGAAKALTLLALPPEERESFMSEPHMVDGEEKTVIDMTSRELEKAIRERDEARRAAETALADAKTAEESRAKMAADMEALENIHRSALEGEARARQELERVQAELQALRDKPVDVAVETVADQEAIDRARADAIAGMQEKLDKAETARKSAEARRKAAEAALSESRKQAGANADILSRAEKAEAELAQVRSQLEAAAKEEKQAQVNADPDLVTFNVLFTQAQEQVNKMHSLRLKLAKEDAAIDQKLKAAILALADAVRRCAE